MNKKGVLRTFAVLAGGAMTLTAIPLSACTKERDDIVIMAEEFSGLFNPFYATSGSDMEVVGLTQISMLTTDSNGNLVAGENEATVVLDYEIGDDGAGNGVYTFIIKNGLKFSDGVPLTMNDVMFNIYEYLDPVYTGSSTMYSVKIKGLSQYRTQQALADDTAADELQDATSREAYQKAGIRRSELTDIYKTFLQPSSSGNETYYATEDDMKDAIRAHTVSEQYKEVVPMAEGDTDYNKKLLDEYERVLTTFRKELNSDFSAARESYDTTTAPYDQWASKFESDIFKFFLFEGYIKPKYALNDTTHKEDKSKIERFENESDYVNDKYNTQEKAVDKVFTDNIRSNFEAVVTAWGTAGDIMTFFAAEAKEMIIKNQLDGGSLKYPRVEGIESLGHQTNPENSVTIKSSVSGEDKTYNIAYQHNPDGTPVNAGEYDILRITLNGKDPKAKYNFSFTVAPEHYYSGLPVDIAKNQFGVEYASASFQSKTIQSQRNVEVPLGAGPYKASNANNDDNPAGSEFWRNNYVFYKANSNFMFPVKTEKLRYQYVSSSNALDKLENKEIDFVTPQFTKANSDRLTEMEKKGFAQLYAWQLGYGYVGINAGKVKNLNARKAIMSAMQAELATEYYKTGTCTVIDWPMSNQSWAYPTENGSSKPNGKDYTQWTGSDAAIEKINDYTQKAKSEGETNFTYKFTIAGSSITEHPTYSVFKQAMELLNECGWNVEVKADSQALTKLSTGSLEVWAAAWGSTIDPDMYQVYHKNSSATSVYAWGYREILADQGTYSREYAIISNQLSPLIDAARRIEDEARRAEMYEEAMGYVLNLAVEMPIYQRQNLYAYDANRIGGINEKVNPFTSPLEKIWNIELI